ncbi:PREDICTED: fatty acid 2-hydroxylase [Wasmannia auropunctata]|uniref:fatty acid 2-hydroxylase n=1 Tax=Wasmannia auropunctata TaxID=64793 RepID=UPI0005EDD669|nr:PREDICTED: fatty acid 2-hydroxylase [Wasmannia auropunctata]XP_011692150.1 PREDICTED: fatty acid 2-hydroxylase [Wasmannia auropunctata]XP_011692151.1 PREDICTED: fatty acid 2-hydroxylase [Wasmannia auropunctata]
MAARRRKNHDSTCHSESLDGNVFKMNDTGAVRAKVTEDDRDGDDTSRRESTEFLVKYRDRVYNIYNFLKNHPGGKNTLIRFKDRAMDGELAKYPHSKSAYYLLEEFALKHQERYNECENLVNWDAPLLWQVGYMGDRYWEWVNLPVDRPIRYFQSDILEILSITPWYMVPIVWVPIITYFLYMGCVLHISTNTAITTSFKSIVPSVVLGLFIWTVAEYVLHRKVFHFKPPDDSKWLITLHFMFHGSHHKAPMDERRLVFPPTFSLFVITILWPVYKSLFSQAHFVAVGSMIGYLCYDLMHYYLHNGAPTADSYLYKMKRRHNYHHFIHHNQGFGVTSELWDRVFKTALSLRKLNEPIKW